MQQGAQQPGTMGTDDPSNWTVVRLSTQELKVLRRLRHLQAGRHELLITVGHDGGVVDWMVRSWGKVER